MSLKRGLYVQLQVVHALILRETRTRFGAHQMGYLWALFEPLLWIGTFAILFAIGSRSAPTGMSMVGFLVTGMVPYQLFRESTSRVSAAVSSNKGLLFYPMVQPLDLMLARTILEGATFISIFVLLIGAEALVLGHFDPDNLLLTLTGLVLAVMVGGSFGMILGSLSLYFPSLQKFTGALMRPLFWLSGVFYTANDVPMRLMDYVQYNPLMHCIDMVRDGWYPEYTSRQLSISFPVVCVLVFTFVGLVFERASRTRIQLT